MCTVHSVRKGSVFADPYVYTSLYYDFLQNGSQTRGVQVLFVLSSH